MSTPSSKNHDHIDYWLQLSPKDFLLAEVNEIRTLANAISGLIAMATQNQKEFSVTAQAITDHTQRIVEVLNVALIYAQNLEQ